LTHQYLSNIGPADEIRKAISVAVASNESQETIFLLLDTARTLSVTRTQRMNSELIVHAKDVEDDASIVLHLPYDNSVAQATIITYPKGGH
jgi:hypothetical protein